jgi:hypothetical protein
MNRKDQAEEGGINGFPTIILEVGHPVLDRQLELPVTIQNLAADVVTLQATRQENGWRPDVLKGAPVNLRFPEEEAQESVAIPGVVRWVSQSDKNKNQLLLGLELASPTPEVRQALKDGIRHTPRDICVLWERWDDMATQERKRRFSNRNLTLLATALLTGGLACQIVNLAPFQFCGFFLIFLGMATAGFRAYKSWWVCEPEEEF